MLIEALFYFFSIIICIQVVYYIVIFSKFSFLIQPSQHAKNLPVSVIICAKNEAENLKINLPSIIEQDYVNFEVVLVDDDSSDDSLEIMENFAKKHDNIKVVKVKTIEKYWGNKKYALTLGIKASSHNFLLFTDADCKAASNQWIKSMTSHFSSTKSIVLGYGAMNRKKGSALNKLIRYETLLTAIQYFAYTKLGMPYMGVGRNLAYKKDLFFEASGFMSHMHIKSGDDDLFVNQMGHHQNTAICFTKEGFTYSDGKESFKSWILQKRRHVSTAKHYKSKHKFFLSVFYLTQLLFWVLAILMLSFQIKLVWVAALIFVRFLVQYVTVIKGARKLNESDLWPWIVFLDLFLVCSQLIIFTRNLISKPNHWK